MKIHYGDSDNEPTAMQPNIEIERTEQNNLRIAIKPEHVASKDITDANATEIREFVETVLSETPRKPHAIKLDRQDGTNIIFDCTKIDFDNQPHGSLSHLGTLVRQANRTLSAHGLRDNVEVISRDPVLKNAWSVTGMGVIAKLTDPDSPVPSSPGNARSA